MNKKKNDNNRHPRHTSSIHSKANLRHPVGRADMVRLRHELPDAPIEFLAELCGFQLRTPNDANRSENG